MKKILKGAAAAAGILAAVEAGASAYLYRRTMKRSKTDVERTMKMAGTDWNQYMPLIQERKERLMARPHEDVYKKSGDGLMLHAIYVPQKQDGQEERIAVCFHGYTGQASSDFCGISDYYIRNGYSLLLVDQRAHGKSEGEYIGFGCLDRIDACSWIDWVIEHCGREVKIVLHGISMGGATVLMTGGLELPEQVKGIISDCGFTSPKKVFTHVLHSMYHMPAFPIMQITDIVNRKKAGYGLDECNAAREVRKARGPLLLIHGDADTFVPCSMCGEIEQNCQCRVTKLIVKGAAHAESYYKDMEAYENAMTEFLEGVMK
ncbi:MAG: alpha/beta hydrolase [Eubacterium sp.]|jgi:fermentation-respiration switch protein FrsA (DUF1100 family)|nr:alpha/beta hydrolase [Eubacterium sp.]